MQKKDYTVNFGDAVTVFPKKAVKRIIKGEASVEEIRVLAALLASDTKISDVKLCTQTGLDEEQVTEALGYWKGVGVISCEKNTAAAEKDAKSAPEPKEDEVKDDAKKVLRRDLPKYTGLEISAILESDGGKLRDMLDACQQLLGHIFTPTETNRVLSLCSWLGLEAEYVVTLVAYYVEKHPKCNVAYIEKVAIDLVNDGIISLEDLDNYIKERELYDGVAGKIRTIAGIGGREYTKKENNFINRWAKDFNYGFDIIKLAYEICCDANGSFNFSYVDKVLENWFKAGVKTLTDAENENRKFAEQKGKGASGAASFDTTEFFGAALQRTYKSMTKKPSDGNPK